MTRFIHTADWQLGMTRHFLEGEAQARFTQDRFDAIIRIGQLATEHKAEFVIVAGDVFEHNRLERRTVKRALDALAKIPVPVYLLPGNHDTLDAASIYDSAIFQQHCPEHVHVIRDTKPLQVASGVELIGAPWRSKRPLTDLVAEALNGIAADDVLRVVVGHGVIDELNPDRDDPSTIDSKHLVQLLDSGAIHYVGLGDRHSITEIHPRIWYSGAHVATDYRDFQQTQPNQVLLVDVAARDCQVEPLQVGNWQFLRKQYRVDTSDDVDAFADELEAIPDKQRTVLKAGFQGTLDMALSARLDSLIEHAQDLLAGFTLWQRKTSISMTPTETDLEQMQLRGFAHEGFQRLLAVASVDGPRRQAAEDGLALLYRLSNRHLNNRQQP